MTDLREYYAILWIVGTLSFAFGWLAHAAFNVGAIADYGATDNRQ